MKPKVAVVVPVLNEARLLPELARQLSALDADETLLVDGGSSDGTGAAAENAGLRVVRSPKGRARQMNAGARATRADLLLFLHADTRLPRDALEKAAAAVERGAVGGCFRLRIASRDQPLRAAAPHISWRSRVMASATGDQAIFVTRPAFERLRGYRELSLCEDLDLVARLSHLGRFVCLDDYAETSARRWAAGGVNRTIALMWALRIGWHLGVPPDTLGRLYQADVR